MSFFKWLLLSLSLHALFIGLFKLFNLPTPREKVELTLIEVPSSGSSPKGSAPLQKNKNFKNPSSLLKKELFTQYHFSAQTWSQGADTYHLNPQRDEASAAWGSGAGTFERIEDYRLYKEIYTHIDGSLYYPAILARNKISGAVNARLVLNSQGYCQWQQTQIYANDIHLRIFILSTLKKACSQSYKPYLAKRELTNVDLSFLFQITEHDEKYLKEEQQKILGNVLFFYRNSQQSIAEWNIGPFKGLFPLPAIQIDFNWLKTHWDQLNGEEDPLQKFKRENS